MEITTPTNGRSSTRAALFGIVCGAHFMNHFQSAMLAVIYPLMMKDLGISLLGLASIAATYSTISNVSQGLYGFIVPHVRRGILLGAGNCMLGLSVVGSGFASSYPHFFTTRVLGSVGASPQHPVGSSILASHFGDARGRALAFHSTAGQIGGLAAPILSALLIIHLGWRGLFWTVGIVTALMGLICFAFRDRLRRAPSDKPRSRLTPLGWEAYKKCLKNKNMLLVSLVFMVGAAGRGQDINEIYIIPHFVNDFHISITQGAMLFTLIQIGSLFGPMVWGWASDRFNRKRTIQVSLFLSAVSTIWLGWQQDISASLFANLVFYGAAVASRQTLTQALLSDLVGEDLFDAAFSLYYFIGFVSIPFWTLVTGGVMMRYGFGPAFTLISTSYLLGMILLVLVRVPGKDRKPLDAKT